MNFFEDNQILCNQQHGFRKRRSCESQLLTTVQDLASGLDNQQQMDAILLDFSKAFDKVPHQRLLMKLEHYGATRTTLQWIRSFLSDRTQKVVVECKSSSSAPVTSGVPHGTVLAPSFSLHKSTTCHPESKPMPVSSLMIDYYTATSRRLEMQSVYKMTLTNYRTGRLIGRCISTLISSNR